MAWLINPYIAPRDIGLLLDFRAQLAARPSCVAPTAGHRAAPLCAALPRHGPWFDRPHVVLGGVFDHPGSDHPGVESLPTISYAREVQSSRRRGKML